MFTHIPVSPLFVIFCLPRSLRLLIPPRCRRRKAISPLTSFSLVYLAPWPVILRRWCINGNEYSHGFPACGQPARHGDTESDSGPAWTKGMDNKHIGCIHVAHIDGSGGGTKTNEFRSVAIGSLGEATARARPHARVDWRCGWRIVCCGQERGANPRDEDQRRPTGDDERGWPHTRCGPLEGEKGGRRGVSDRISGVCHTASTLAICCNTT